MYAPVCETSPPCRAWPRTNGRSASAAGRRQLWPRLCVRLGSTLEAVALSPQTLSLDDRRRVAAWAAGCAEQVLQIFETAAPLDTRVHDAIDLARRFASGELAVGEAIRRRGGDAGGAARDAPTPSAKAAAFAAEQAASCAHMGAHALGAAGYAAKALALAADEDQRDDAVRSAVVRQLSAMDDAVANAVSSLPTLGVNTAGPLGPGRLTGGYVGKTIRAIQAALQTRSTSCSDRGV